MPRPHIPLDYKTAWGTVYFYDYLFTETNDKNFHIATSFFIETNSNEMLDNLSNKADYFFFFI